MITSRSERCNEITLHFQTPRMGTAHIFLFLHSYAAVQSTYSAVLRRKPYYIHKLAQMRVSLETSIHQEGRTGGLRGQILGFLLMCSLLSVPPAVDGSSPTTHSNNSKLACMKQENRFYPLPCLRSVHFACHYPAPRYQASEPITTGSGRITILSNSIFSIK